MWSRRSNSRKVGGRHRVMRVMRAGVLLVLAACATTSAVPPTGPRAPRSSDATKEPVRWPEAFATGTAADYAVPWVLAWDSAAHRKAVLLQTDEQVVITPLQRPDLGGVLRLELRCQRAWMMLAPAGTNECPRDRPGLSFDGGTQRRRAEP
jgi:hypothetical protein